MCVGMSHSHHGHHHHHSHDHGSHQPRAVAAAPTFSLLRLSIWQRLAGSAIGLAVLWLMILQVME
jgi:hypothetical protein